MVYRAESEVLKARLLQQLSSSLQELDRLTLTRLLDAQDQHQDTEHTALALPATHTVGQTETEPEMVTSPSLLASGFSGDLSGGLTSSPAPSSSLITAHASSATASGTAPTSQLKPLELEMSSFSISSAVVNGHDNKDNSAHRQRDESRDDSGNADAYGGAEACPSTPRTEREGSEKLRERRLSSVKRTTSELQSHRRAFSSSCMYTSLFRARALSLSHTLSILLYHTLVLRGTYLYIYICVYAHIQALHV